MSRENGTIAIIADETSGELYNDSGVTFGYQHYVGPPVLKENDRVSFDNNGDGMATNITVTTPVIDPTYPKNSDYPGATIINTPVTGNLTVASNTTTIINGVAVSGEVIIQDNATLVFKSSNPSDPNTRASATRITNVKTRDANGKPLTYYANPTLIMWGSKTSGNLRLFGHTGVKITGAEIGGDAILTGSATSTFTSTIGKAKVRGSAEFKSFKGLQINDLRVSKNINLSTNSTLSVNTLASETGSIQLNSNPSAIYSNVTVVRNANAQNAIRTDGCVAILSAEAI